MHTYSKYSVWYIYTYIYMYTYIHLLTHLWLWDNNDYEAQWIGTGAKGFRQNPCFSWQSWLWTSAVLANTNCQEQWSEVPICSDCHSVLAMEGAGSQPAPMDYDSEVWLHCFKRGPVRGEGRGRRGNTVITLFLQSWASQLIIHIFLSFYLVHGTWEKSSTFKLMCFNLTWQCYIQDTDYLKFWDWEFLRNSSRGPEWRYRKWGYFTHSQPPSSTCTCPGAIAMHWARRIPQYFWVWPQNSPSPGEFKKRSHRFIGIQPPLSLNPMRITLIWETRHWGG